LDFIHEKYAVWGLPVLEVAEEVNRCLLQDGAVVVTAPPGAGKSTLLPLTLLEGFGGVPGKILMLEPRRIAARQIAERISRMIGEPVGETVGYRMRFESMVSQRTRIEIITEGILSRMLIDDPSLEGISVIVFDEFHERSLDTDLALALTIGSRKFFRPDLKLAILSATLEAESICRFLHCRHVESKGKMFPVDIRYDSTGTDTEEIASLVRKVHQEERGDILVFLPGEWEIRRCAERLEGTLGKTVVYPLYGMLSNEEQRAAIAPSREGERKVVLATPIAETSITIEGVRVVIDSGLCRRMTFNPSTSLSRLETIRISRDMADQRAGRAGRTASGVCLRLWNAAIQDRMEPVRRPEVTDADLSQTVLTAALWGELDVRKLDWLTPPPTANIFRAETLLKNLGALDEEGNLTPKGRKIGKFPCHPRIASMLLQADTSQKQSLAADIAALLEEKDPLPEKGADMCERVEALRRHRHEHGLWERLNRISTQYRQLMGCRQEDNSTVSPREVGALLAAAYPERVAMQVNEGRGLYLLANGDMALLDTNDILVSSQWIAIASLNSRPGSEGKIFLASTVNPSDLEFLVRRRENVSWNAKRAELTIALESRIGRLVIESQPLSGVNPQRVVEAVCDAAPKDGLSMFNFDEMVGNLQRRVATAALWHPEMNFPDLSTERVLAIAREWVPFYLGRATTAAQMKKIDMCEVLWGLLMYEQQQALGQIVPSHITVPTGSSIRVEYRQGAEAPILRVRLQECFGLMDTPMVDYGHRPVLMELLSPGFKPVQLTSDLRSFWNSTYFEVRKELRRRYPKHSWPEDPLTASAVRGVRRPD